MRERVTPGVDQPYVLFGCASWTSLRRQMRFSRLSAAALTTTSVPLAAIATINIAAQNTKAAPTSVM